jgi:uncharacterized protein (DUF1499 family)
MDQQTNKKGPSGTEGREMKVGDKVWVLCVVKQALPDGFQVKGCSGGVPFWALAEDCRPVEPEAVIKESLKTESDPVNPSHYKQGPAETIDIIEAAIAKAPNNKAAGLHWQVLKYALRCWLKNGVEDLKKARWYLDRLIQEEEAK